MDDLAQAVERLGQTLEVTGIPRMPARVFAYVLAEDRSTYSAAELAEGLGISAAAVSGAVRYLTGTHLLVRERNPAGRGDLFRVRDGDIWGTIQGARLMLLDRMLEQLDEAVRLLPEGSAGRARVEETRDYFTFAHEDSRGHVERWNSWRAARRGA